MVGVFGYTNIKMVRVASFVFLDIETTGLPHLERNGTKIIELALVAVLREDLEEAAFGSRPYVAKLTLLLNPQKKISPRIEEITGITNQMLQNAPVFEEKCDTILAFLKELPNPVCLVAHNGYNFDYKILLAEFADIRVPLPDDLLCVDSLVGFRKIHDVMQKYPLLATLDNSSYEDSKGSENWPDLDISTEDWNELDVLCSSFADIKPFETSQSSLNVSAQSDTKNTQNEKMSFKLTDLYKKMCKKEVINAHRAEDDCLMLLEIVVAAKEFLVWTDKYRKNIHDIDPLKRA